MSETCTKPDRDLFTNPIWNLGYDTRFTWKRYWRVWQRDFLRHTPQLLTAWWRRSLLGWKRAPPKPPSLVCFCWKVCLIGHRRVEFELFGFLEWAILRLCPAAGVSERRVLWEGEWSYWGYEVGWEFPRISVHQLCLGTGSWPILLMLRQDPHRGKITRSWLAEREDILS